MTVTPLLPSLSFDSDPVHTEPAQFSAPARIDFLCDAAHEIRSPLACLKGYGDLLARGNVAAGDLQHIGERIRRQATRLSETVEDILELTEIDAHRGANFRFGRVAVEPILYDALDAIEPGRGERIQIAIRGGLLPSIMADPARLSRALVNVLDNALKYSDCPHQVTLSANHGRRRGTRTRPCVSIRIHDRGIGMAADDARRAFERFFRAQAVADRPGTGLGLAISQQIVRLHQGEIKLRSRLGFGTVVSITLPVADA